MLPRLLILALASATAYAGGADLYVPRCPSTATAKFTTQIPSGNPCPPTTVDLCYTNKDLSLVFTAYGETNYYFDPTQETNGDIWEYEVMEAFIYKGSDAPQTYLEYEVNPNNVTYNAFVYNPSRDRAPGTPFDHAFITDPFGDGFTVNTVLNKSKGTWQSSTTIPLALFNGENPRGTVWRMNFFRTITSPSTYPNQQLCGWKNTGAASFHITKPFGKLIFV
ncbi:hypothetical protein GGI25_000100 [Coemansia spiralis]|uniref:Carbohydrate-binding domain-containing protein n=2 Tax=Coemansia TaxID=4863 RepID=A0A9W8L0U8_9FUNG|nr:hypothetical protein BX070DRAFT_218747 [Coemansia spiralis]KAJ1992599.1 hypothetical protein EDC05_002745 [Coemansia umbellata]KAJ2620289.1 hypothetical protein GGI26_005113 [Coemansia sp. RSA 1358]KAJ2681145.1 hypothetical protein GGI25_000100 [Coemansia spiralis]